MKGSLKSRANSPAPKRKWIEARAKPQGLKTLLATNSPNPSCLLPTPPVAGVWSVRVPRTCFHNLANFPPARPAGWGSKCSKPLGSDEPRREREPSQWQQFTPSARQKIKAAQQRYFGESERKTALAGNGATAPLLGAAGVWVLSLSWGTPKSPLPAACTQKSLRPAESRVTTPPRAWI